MNSAELIRTPQFWLLLGLVLLIYQVVVSVLVVRSAFYDLRQKLAQLALIWLLPLLGALLAHWFATRGASPLPRHDSEFVPQDKPTLGQR